MMWADMLAGHRVGWFAQALPADDAGVHAQLARQSRVPVAVGESPYSASQFKDYMLQGAAQIVQVDVARIGGITPWLKVAHMAEAFNLAVCPHFLMELHVSLVTAVPNGWMLEYIPQLDAITTSRLDLRGGRAHPPMTPGLGIDWDWDAIKAQTVDGSHATLGGE
jgi:L-alanine-DL-glutamate epimerase-like enolase superfamily enzyme